MSGLFAHKAKNNREKIRSQRRWAVDKLQFRHIPNQTRYLSCTCTSLISFISRASPTSRFLRPGEVPLRAHKSLGAFPPTGLLSKSQLLSARSCRSQSLLYLSSQHSILHLLDCCFCSVIHVCLFATPRTAAHQASLSSTISQGLLRLMSIQSVMPSNHLILCCSLLLLPPVFPSINEVAVHIKWSKYWSFSLSISPSNHHYPNTKNYQVPAKAWWTRHFPLVLQQP